MSLNDRSLLAELAKKYVWWTTPEQALEYPQRLVAHIMNIGDFSDVQAMARALGDDYLRRVIATAEAGQFTDRSWHYWHYRLGLAELDSVPPMPERRVA